MTTSTADNDPSGGSRPIPPLMIAAWEGATSDPDPLGALGAARALGALLSTWESTLVGEAMAAGATWEVVGGTVGVSRQAAWERFHHDVNDFRRQVKADARALRDRHRQETRDLHDRVKRQAKSMRQP